MWFVDKWDLSEHYYSVLIEYRSGHSKDDAQAKTTRYDVKFYFNCYSCIPNKRQHTLQSKWEFKLPHNIARLLKAVSFKFELEISNKHKICAKSTQLICLFTSPYYYI